MFPTERIGLVPDQIVITMLKVQGLKSANKLF